MSFGFGVSDFIAVGELIVKIINTLHDTQSEYRELSRELEGYVKSRVQRQQNSQTLAPHHYDHDHGLIGAQSTKSFKPSR